MEPVSKRPILWQYSRGFSRDSVGDLRGKLHTRLFRDIYCWEAKGTARLEFDTRLAEDVSNFLKDNFPEVYESGTILELGLLMIGKSAERAKPTVMLISEDKSERKRAFEMVKKSGILAKYPGFELGHSDFGKLIPLSGSAPAILSTNEGPLGGRRLYHRASGPDRHVRAATAGGIVSYQNKLMFLTVNHFLENSQKNESAIHNPDLDMVEDCEITGLEDLDDSDGDGHVNSGSFASQSSPPAEPPIRESLVGSVPQTLLESPGSLVEDRTHHDVELPEGDCIVAGKAILRSSEYDYALVEVDTGAVDLTMLGDTAVHLEDPPGIEANLSSNRVEVDTPGCGTVTGTLETVPRYVRLPGTRSFSKVYSAEFEQPLRRGDCGAWVRDAATGRFLGHIFAGTCTGNVGAIMPASVVLEDAKSILEARYASGVYESDNNSGAPYSMSTEEHVPSLERQAGPGLTRITDSETTDHASLRHTKASRGQNHDPPSHQRPATRSNLSFVLNKPHDVEFQERPIPTLRSPDEVLVAVNYTGICGTDVHYWMHGRIGDAVVTDPMVLGHESSGTVVEVGHNVKTLKKGDRVAIEPGYPCCHCVHCMAGHYNLCPEMRFAATPPDDGTLTGFWAAPANFCYRLPDKVSLQEGALIEPLAVGVHIVRQARVTPGQSVVVMGAGPVGLLCAAVARAFGAAKVVQVDIVQSKLDFALGFAATHAYISQRASPEQNAHSIIALAGLGAGADVVIEASGAEPSIQAALHAVRAGGTYVQGGMGKTGNIAFPIMGLCLKEVTARGSFRYGSGDFRLAIELVAMGKVDLKKLVTGVVPFEQAEEALKMVREGKVIKVLIAGPNEKGVVTSGAIRDDGGGSEP